MIRYLTENHLPDFLSFCEKDAFGCKIASLATAYGLQTSFAGFWMQTGEEGTITAALSKLDNAAVLYATNQADMAEIEAFLPACGAAVILCNPHIAVFSKGRTQSDGRIMQYHSDASPVLERFQMETNPSVQEVYKVLRSSDALGFTPPPFEAFYVDLSHRIRHHCARCIGIQDEQRQLCSCASSIAETPKTAVLGAVATRPDCRGQGFASYLVQQLSTQLAKEGKSVFLFRSERENQHFYQQIGFQEIALWREITL